MRIRGRRGRERGVATSPAKVEEPAATPPFAPAEIRPAAPGPRVVTRQGRGAIDVLVDGHRIGAVKAFGRRYRPGQRLTVQWWGLCNLCARTMPLGRKDAHGAVRLLVDHWRVVHDDGVANGGAA